MTETICATAPSTQERIFTYLKGGRVHPAIILAGPASAPKIEIAKRIACFLLCNQAASRPCGQCSSCRRIEKELHPDVLILREEGEETIKIDSVRELIHQVSVAPIEGKAKICIVPECHRMNAASMNAFLKTLEEPGENRYFLLLTSQPNSLLPTVLSRCVLFAFRPEAPVELSAETPSEWEELLKECVAAQSPAPAVQALGEKDRCLDFIRYLQSRIRGSALGLEPPLLDGRFSLYELVDKFEATLALEGRLRSNANYGLLSESFLRQEFLFR